MEKPALLEISRVEDTYRFRLEQPKLGAAVREYATLPISKSDQQRLRLAMDQAAHSSSGPFSLEDLGRLMYNLLLPPEIQAFLRDLDTPLLISTDVPEIPWELFYEDESRQFIGLKCAVGRRLVTQTDVQQRPVRAEPQAPAFLLIGNPQEDLKGAEQEIERLEDLVARTGGSSRVLVGTRASLLPIQLELQSGADYTAMHYAGHADHDRSSRQEVLLLAERTRLGSDAIRRLLRGHPFVFLNACGTDQPGAPGRRTALPWQVTEGLAAAFIGGGARAVVGTRCEVDDRLSADFAVGFYEGALRGVPIGEALRQARARFHEAHPGDSTWAAFILYGDPGLLLIEPPGVFLPDGCLNRARFSALLNQAFDLLPREAQQLGYDFIGTPHLFIVLTRMAGSGTQEALQRLGFPPRQVREHLRQAIYRGQPRSALPLLDEASFSERARRILQAADEEARLAGAAQIEERHLLPGLLREAQGPAVASLRQQGIDPERLLAALQGEGEAVESSPGAVHAAAEMEVPDSIEVNLAPDARQALAFALQEARRMGHEVLNTAHLVIGLTKIQGGCSARALQQQGLDPKRVRDSLRQALPVEGPARDGALGIREAVVSARVQRILSRASDEARAEAAPAVGECHLLMGFLSEGGGSTAELLRSLGVDLQAMQATLRSIQRGETLPSPTPLLDRFGRDLTREAHEGRLKPLVGRHREVARIAQVLARADKNTPLLIGEAGVGKTAIVEGLAQRIAAGQVPEHLRGKRIVELQVANLVAGTKYRGEMEERLMQIIREASQPDVILFLDEVHTLVGAGRGEGGALDAGNILKPALARGEIRCIGATTAAEFRKSIEKDAALERRFQPIVIKEPTPDEALEILRQAAQRYESHHGVRLSGEALEAAVSLSVAYLPGRRLPDKACDLVDEACVRARVGSASKWSSGPEAGQPRETPLIDADAVARVVAEWTGIPLARLTEAEQARLLKLEELLRQRVIGQERAIASVAQAVRLGRAGLKKPDRPTAVFLFAGPTGVGKTELAKALAGILFGSEAELIRLDMSEYGEAHNVARLIGSPPGYRDHDEGGQLTEALHRKSYAVVLLDEIEKAHPRALDLFLQLFDDGRITDGRGRVADGRNAIFIMTSNVATSLSPKRRPLGLRPVPGDDQDGELLAELRRTFRPEFLNRIDEVIVFDHLSAEHVRAIAQLWLQALTSQLTEQHGITLTVEPGALDLICEQGYSEEYGARPLQRAIERMISGPMSRLILEGARGRIVARVEGDRLDLSLETSSEEGS